MSITTEHSADRARENIHTYIARAVSKYKRRLYFTETGLARLASIEGYLAALADTGHELSYMMATDFYAKLDRLAESCDAKFVIGSSEITVPSSKVVLSDDGTKHGFSLLWLYPVNPEAYQTAFEEHRIRINSLREAHDLSHPKCKECGYQEYLYTDTPHQLAVKDWNISENLNPNEKYSEEFTEYRFVGNQQIKVYYRYAYNGGLIYHGPGAGENFTVNIGNTYWGIHT